MDFVPFKLTYSPQLSELIFKSNLTIVLSTFQAGKLIFISAIDENNLTQLPRNFKKVMGIAIEGDKMAVATENQVVLLKNDKRFATNYPKAPNKYDAFYAPRSAYYTGFADIHDLDFGKDGLYAVNTAFSCICKINSEWSFEPIWQPSWITKLESEDRCHLNGLAMKDGEPFAVTALGNGDTPQSWREHIVDGGQLIDFKTKEVLLDKLAMPHSPRVYKNGILFLESATGYLSFYDSETKTKRVIKQLNYFTRGLAIFGSLAFIATSKLRQNSSTFKHLDIARISDCAGIIVVHIETGALVGELKYETTVDEIYDVQILENTNRPNILNNMDDKHFELLSIPSSVYWKKEKEKE